MLRKHWSLAGSERVNTLDMPLQAFLSRTAEVFPDKTAIMYGVQKVSYRQLDEWSSRFANALVVNCGVKKGDRVALFLLNGPQFVVAYFGVLKAGAVVTVISPLHKELEVEQQLCDSGAQSIVVLESLYAIVERVMGKTLLRNVIVTGVREGEVCFGGLGVCAGLNVFDFWGLIEKSVVELLDFRFVSGGDLAVLQYTSGTASVPKGVMLSHTNLVSNVSVFASWIKGVCSDVFLSVLPFFHVYGMTTSMLTPISLGAEMVLLSRFDVMECLRVINQCRVSVFCGSSSMFSMLSEAGGFERCDLSSIRVCISGASRLLSHVQERFMRAGVFLVEGYGLTEASPVTHCTPIDRSVGLVKLGSVGLALPGTDVRIVDVETGCREVAVGEVGELCVRGLQVMCGYWQDPVGTARVLREGWLFTGDIVYTDSDGYVYIVDRKKDLIKCKGYSVYPRELEDVLYGHPAVKFCVVIGKPDVLYGEVPKAFVVFKEGFTVTREELVEFVNSKIAGYKALGDVELCSELPYGFGGKVLRRVLEEGKV